MTGVCPYINWWSFVTFFLKLGRDITKIKKISLGVWGGVSWISGGGHSPHGWGARPNYFRGQSRTCLVHWSFKTHFWGMGALSFICWWGEALTLMGWGLVLYTDLCGWGVLQHLTWLLFYFIIGNNSKEATAIYDLRCDVTSLHCRIALMSVIMTYDIDDLYNHGLRQC